jgi:hypothetical protein
MIGLTPPITPVERADILHCQESFRVDLVYFVLNIVNVSSSDAATYYRNCAIFSTAWQFGSGIACGADGFSNSISSARTDDSHVTITDGQSFLDQHPQNIAGGESARIPDQVP